jgi:hypothetical protein
MEQTVPPANRQAPSCPKNFMGNYLRIKIGQTVQVECTDNNFNQATLDVIVQAIIVNVTYSGFLKSGKRVDFVEYKGIGTANNNDFNEPIFLFDHPDTPYKWAYLHQIKKQLIN